MQVYTDEKVWKYIPDYDGLYQASSHGDIKSLKFGKERILKSGVNSSGYDTVVLCKDGVRKTSSVHRLVMYAHSHVDTKLTINHIDENKRNNHISNLEYCTNAENVRKYHRNNPEFQKELSRMGVKAIEKLWRYIETGEVFRMTHASFMMHDTGQAEGKWVWYNILQRGKPQDKFIRVN